MKKRFFCGLSVTLALALCLLGCGAKAGSSSAQAVSSSIAYSAEPQLPEPEEFQYDIAFDDFEAANQMSSIVQMSPADESTPPPNDPISPPDTRKIILHANMDLETMDFDAALSAIHNTVSDAGGYIESQSQGGGVSYASRGRYQPERFANIQARVPSDQLQAVMGSVGGCCNVLSQSQSMDDISDSYFDAQAHLDTLRLQEQRLLDILEKADKLDDVISLESALSDVRYQIERLTAALRRMDNQVAFSYLNLSLQEVVEYQQIQEKPRSYLDRIREAAADGLDTMVDGLQDFSVAALRMGPSLLVWAVIIAVVVLIIRAILRANAKRREAKGLPTKRSPLIFTTGQTKYPKYPHGVQPEPPQDQADHQDDQEQTR